MRRTTLQIDVSVQRYAESRVQARASGEVGTLVGRRAPGKDLLLQALRTPDSDCATPPSPAPAAASLAKRDGTVGVPLRDMQLDEERVVDHAAMVERVLPGGLDVVGVYVLCSAAEFVRASGALLALLTQAAHELNRRLSTMLVLHIDSTSARMSAREATPGAGLRPRELRTADVLGQMVQLQSRYQVSLQLPVTSGKQALQATFQVAANAAAARVYGALGLMSGELASCASQVGDCMEGSGASPKVVQLLVRPNNSLAANEVRGSLTGAQLHGRAENGVVGAVGLVGGLDCRALVHEREVATAAVAALQADVTRSLQARLDTLLDAAVQQEAPKTEQRREPDFNAMVESAAHPLFAAAKSSKALMVPLPRRAFLAAGGIYFSDYFFEGESTQAVLGRLQLLLPGLASAVECWEQAGPWVELTKTHSTRQEARYSKHIMVAALPVLVLVMAVTAIALLLSHLAMTGSQ